MRISRGIRYSEVSCVVLCCNAMDGLERLGDLEKGMWLFAGVECFWKGLSGSEKCSDCGGWWVSGCRMIF